MKIAMRDSKGKQWRKAAVKVYKAEREIQDILFQSPDLIPVDDIGDGVPELRVCIKEAGLPGSGNTDLIAIDETGGITIIECKLASNPDVRRKVVGQLLEYAAHLWGMTYEQFDEIAKTRLNAPLTTLMRQRVPEENEWAEEDFRQAVAENLRSGRFRLLVVVDNMNDELRRVVEYLNSRSLESFEVLALELRYFAHGDIELLVPQLHGATGRRPPKRQWDEGRFFDELEKQNTPDVARTARALYAFTQEHASRVWWGVGRETGSFTFHIMKGKATISVFTVATDGLLWINLGYMHGRVPPVALRDFADRLRALPGFGTLGDDLTKLRSFRIERTLCLADALPGFEQAVLELKRAVLADATAP